MEERHPRERELVLAPNEYAYVLDTTKGQINTYVGPNKTSLAQTDQPVRFNPRSKRFEPAELHEAVQLFATAPANWYVVLKNPARDNAHPQPGVSNTNVELRIGDKLNVRGPVSFALSPGQMAQVVPGHRLRTNEYLYAWIYDAELAAAGWADALAESRRDESAAATVEPPRFVTGQKLIIRGTDTAFYIPPTGIEVIPDRSGARVRRAVTLQRLQYCVLVGEDGRKRFVRGEAVVFPQPDEQFVEGQGRRDFPAIELNEITGIYVKVIAPYADEDGTEHAEGEELFITGKSRIYFPRHEHAIIRYRGHELHHAVAIPRGEGRYLLDRLSGEVELVSGPTMLLPDPRREVITRRVLDDREVQLLFPGNQRALAHNRALRGEQRPDASAEPASSPAPPAGSAVPPPETGDPLTFVGSDFTRSFQAPRTITLDTKYEGAVAVDVWAGYAVQVVDRVGGRRVVIGPQRVLLGYDEMLEALSLSRGVPKGSKPPLSTVYLHVAANKVSDRIELTSADMVRADLSLKYRVSFEGDDPARWFAVDDYVKLLCDHASSMLKAMARCTPIGPLRAEIADRVRDTILGKKGSDGRAGLCFGENAMRVFDVEVLELEIVDADVDQLLGDAQLTAVSRAIELAERETALQSRRRIEVVERALAEEAHATAALRVQLAAEEQAQQHDLEQQRRQRELELDQLKRQRELDQAELALQLAERRRRERQDDHASELQIRSELQALTLDELRAQVDGAVKRAQAFTPQMVTALNRLGDEQLLGALASNFGELAAIEGRGLLETARRFLDFVPTTLLPTLKREEN